MQVDEIERLRGLHSMEWIDLNSWLRDGFENFCLTAAWMKDVNRGWGWKGLDEDEI